MDIQGKVWGYTSSVFSNNNVEINYIEAKQGGFCSTHRHRCKYNMFYVLEGCLQIEVWKKDYKLIDKTELKPGCKMTICPGEYHRFIAIEQSRAFEIYWVELTLSDIERKNVGGKLKK